MNANHTVIPAGTPDAGTQKNAQAPSAETKPDGADQPAETGEVAFGLKLQPNAAETSGKQPGKTPADAAPAAAPHPKITIPDSKPAVKDSDSHGDSDPAPQTPHQPAAPLPAPSTHSPAIAPAAAPVAQSTGNPVRTDLAPQVAPADRLAAAEAVSTPPPAAPRPVNDLLLHVSSAGDNVAVRVSERAGQVQVIVRSPDGGLNHGLRAELPDLVHRLGSHGTVSEVWRPSESTHTNTDPNQGREQSPQQQGRNQQGENRNPQDQQQNFSSMLADTAGNARRTA
jgi:hypothetical protein